MVALAGAANAQTACTVKTQQQLLLSFADNVGAGAITPQTLRNFVCSTFGVGALAPAYTVFGNNTGVPAAPSAITDISVSRLTLSSNAAIGGTLTVTGTAAFNSAVTFNSSATFLGTLTAADFVGSTLTGSTPTLTVAGWPIGSGHLNGGGIALVGAPGGANGGGISLVGGTAGSGIGGAITLLAGNSSNAFQGAGIGMTTGTGTLGGDFTFTAAPGTDTNRGGRFTFTAGDSGAGGVANGGGFVFTSGNGIAGGNGGNYAFTAGDGSVNGNGGLFSFTPGAGAGSGSAGTLSLNGRTTAYQFQINNNLTTTGTSTAANAWVYLQQSLSGTNATTIYSPLNFAITDSVNARNANGVYGLRVQGAPGVAATPMTGPRTAIFGSYNAQSANNPGDFTTRQLVGLSGAASGSVNQSGRFSQMVSGVATNAGIFQGHLTSVAAQTTGRLGLTAYAGIYGGEFNATLNAGASSNIRNGFKIATGGGNAQRGIYWDAGLQIGEHIPTADKDVVGYGVGIAAGSFTGNYPLDNDSTVLGTYPKLYAAYDPVVFARGVDFRWATITSGGFSFSAPNFQVDDSAGVYARALTTTGTIQAQTGSLTGIAPTSTGGGSYLVFPTITIPASPGGGTNAVATVATMGGESVQGFGNTGKNYLVNDVLTGSGGTGTPPTWTVATVDGSGRITSLTLTSNGTWTIPPDPSTPFALTGGAGTGAYLNVLKYTNETTFTFTPANWEFGATGDSYVVGNVLTLVGDTGTAVQVTVDKVTAQGGIVFTPQVAAFTATSTGTTLSVSAISAGVIPLNGIIYNAGSSTNRVISVYGTGTGGTGDYTLNDTLTISTPTALTIQFGTAVETGVHISTVGSVTAIGAGTYHTVTGGAGTGASLMVTYKILTVTVGTPGTLYTVKPPPMLRTSLTNYRMADLVATMTPVAATLALNPSGGAVTVGGASLTTVLTGTTGSIGGGALLAGACASGTASVTGATTSMAAVASPVAYPGDGNYWLTYVSSANTVTVKVCAAVAGTPSASAYNVRVNQ